jgi:hypothetical protein
MFDINDRDIKDRSELGGRKDYRLEIRATKTSGRSRAIRSAPNPKKLTQVGIAKGGCGSSLPIQASSAANPQRSERLHAFEADSNSSGKNSCEFLVQKLGRICYEVNFMTAAQFHGNSASGAQHLLDGRALAEDRTFNSFARDVLFPSLFFLFVSLSLAAADVPGAAAASPACTLTRRSSPII